jgi:predicted O-linked N-acetylglucosamine transferase (SPINDLY family)
LREGFEACGIARARLDIRPRATHDAFLATHRQVDIALDTFPYHGTTTTCFSLWMGVPVLTLVGATHASRVGLTLLSSVGLPELAAADASAYVGNATLYAARLDELAALRSGLRERIVQSALTDGRACARELEQAYRNMWVAWCGQLDDRSSS